MQGALFPFRSGLASGVTRVAFAPDGALFAGMTDRGWTALARPQRKGKTAPCTCPPTRSRKTRFTSAPYWSPTKTCPANGPKAPPVSSQAKPAGERPVLSYGNQTAGSSNDGSATSGISTPSGGALGAAKVHSGRAHEKRPCGCPWNEPGRRSESLLAPHHSPWLSV